MLKAVCSLEILRITIYNPKHMPSEWNIRAFMIQEMNRLRRLYLRLLNSGRITDRLWEVCLIHRSMTMIDHETESMGS